MKRTIRTTAALLAAGLVASGLALAAAAPANAATSNPILGDGSYYSADPATLVVDDTLYIYAGRDEASATQNDFIMNEWQAFSTTDVDSGVWEHHPALMRPEAVLTHAHAHPHTHARTLTRLCGLANFQSSARAGPVAQVVRAHA